MSEYKNQLPRLIGRGLQMGTLLDFARSCGLRVWAVDCARAKNLQAFKPDVLRAVSIRVFGVAAGFANELALRLSVCLLRMAALIAPPGCISRINKDQRNTAHQGFVSDEASKLCERPTMQPRPFPLSGPDPLADAFEVFKGNRSICALRGLDDAFGNYMVLVPTEPRLFSTAFPKEPLGRFGSFALELPTKCLISVADFVYRASGIVRTIRIVGKLNDSHIDAKAIASLNLPLLRNFNRDIHKPFLITINQIRLSNRIRKQQPLFWSANKWNWLFSSINSPNTQRRFHKLESKHSGIISDATSFSKIMPTNFPCFIGRRNPTDENTNSFRIDCKFVPNLTVKVPLKRKPSKLLFVPRQLREAIARFNNHINCIKQRLRLFWRSQQFDLDGQYHLCYGIS